MNRKEALEFVEAIEDVNGTHQTFYVRLLDYGDWGCDIEVSSECEKDINDDAMQDAMLSAIKPIETDYKRTFLIDVTVGVDGEMPHRNMIESEYVTVVPAYKSLGRKKIKILVFVYWWLESIDVTIVTHGVPRTSRGMDFEAMNAHTLREKVKQMLWDMMTEA